MIKKYIISLFLLLGAVPAFAFPCYFTLAKDSCWANYDIKVIVIDAETNKPLITVEVPKGKSWIRQTFTCQPGQKLMYQASFLPSFWQSEEGKSYMALRFWSLPNEIAKNDTAWDIPVCFPSAFSAVPFPPDATGNCHCDFASIPPIKSQ